MAGWEVTISVAFSVHGPDNPQDAAVFAAQSVAGEQLTLTGDVTSVCVEPIGIVLGQVVRTGQPVDATAAYTDALALALEGGD